MLLSLNIKDHLESEATPSDLRERTAVLVCFKERKAHACRDKSMYNGREVVGGWAMGAPATGGARGRKGGSAARGQVI